MRAMRNGVSTVRSIPFGPRGIAVSCSNWAKLRDTGSPLQLVSYVDDVMTMERCVAVTYVEYKSARVGDASDSKRLCDALRPCCSPRRPSEEPSPPRSPPLFGFPPIENEVRSPAMIAE
jgi:hypothetical protein